MQKALAQNPNLIRTLLGLSFTLIFILAYAVYGATVSPSYYLYQTDAVTTNHDVEQTSSIYNEETNTTTWYWDVPANGVNLTWVNLTATELSDDSIIKLINSAGLYSNRLLGVADADKFSCEDSCYKNSTHEAISEDGSDVSIYSMTTTDPGRRNNGTVYAKTLDDATEKAEKVIEYEHSPSVIKIEIIEKGERQTSPTIFLTTVNEDFSSIEVFSIDAATEFLWALAAVVGCFSMVLIPSFGLYFASRAKERNNELKLKLAEENVDNIIEQE
ncbi:MAG: hypothetical protein CMA30_06665 [Euryarchaeota archaeon]|nr:hypothetical protein [Euryarchaeota archaeon]|tara:strand:+ start:241 stop:1059 length:819 start_codon:yes stop_codon:yes gene_type:complete